MSEVSFYGFEAKKDFGQGIITSVIELVPMTNHFTKAFFELHSETLYLQKESSQQEIEMIPRLDSKGSVIMKDGKAQLKQVVVDKRDQFIITDAKQIKNFLNDYVVNIMSLNVNDLIAKAKKEMEDLNADKEVKS